MILQGKTAAVTGAAGAIGSAIATALVNSGAQVALIDVSLPAVQALAAR
jgi:NAD(P)-dependent dehydrogenase (short-subunit alcohol dehydrogenase family)